MIPISSGKNIVTYNQLGKLTHNDLCTYHNVRLQCPSSEFQACKKPVQNVYNALLNELQSGGSKTQTNNLNYPIKTAEITPLMVCEVNNQ